MPTIPSGRPKSKPIPKSVFLNLPYDSAFESLFLSYLAGVSAFGLEPRASLEIPGGRRRLDRIFELISDCDYSIHDLSRVQLDRRAPSTPRFNMPFELGLAVAHEKFSGNHVWFVFEAVHRRLTKSLSDLDGTDVYIHGGRVNGVFSPLANAFVRMNQQPTIHQMAAIYRGQRGSVSEVLRQTGGQTCSRHARSES